MLFKKNINIAYNFVISAIKSSLIDI